ncbi:MAG: twin-arginine translocase TatA/TatE family subunit [Chloroflexi bacterium]|nr:twin-arginine translocase TatA/TatE family subunit [Chloroflexota bacterium]
MFGLQPQDLMIILVVALLIFGPSRLPEMGKAFGQTLREFQNSTKEITRSIQQEVKPAEPAKPEEPATMACKNCAKQIPLEAKFCPECGGAQ